MKVWPPAMVWSLTSLFSRTSTGFFTVEGPLLPPPEEGFLPSVMVTCRVKTCSALSPQTSV